MRCVDLTGRLFGRLGVVERDFQRRTPVRWVCRCNCDTVISVLASSLVSGRQRSCGCLRIDKAKTHGGYKSPEYHSWKAMNTRCHCPNHPTFIRYGAKGITVCDRWRHSFQNFIDDMGKRPTINHSLDRIDSNGPYSPENCRWATSKMQGENRKTTIVIEHNGRKLTLPEWSRITGIKPSTLRNRRDRGWSVARMLETPAEKRRSKSQEDLP